MSDSIEKLEKKRKSGALAAGLNLIIPGAGYIYCGRVILGIAAFFIAIALVLTLFPFGAILIWLILIIDGFLCAERYNKKLETKIESQKKKCPMCAELVQPEAKVCKHCGHTFESNMNKEAS